jgi:hypothetical protein
MNKSDFIIGKWYKNFGISNTHIGKFSGWCNDGVISVSEYFYKNNLYGPSKRFDSYWQNAELLTDLSEIQKFLPEGHPDKFTTQIQTKDDYKHLIKLLKQL